MYVCVSVCVNHCAVHPKLNQLLINYTSTKNKTKLNLNIYIQILSLTGYYNVLSMGPCVIP